MLPYASYLPACGSVSFLRVVGEGRDGGQRADEVVCPKTNGALLTVSLS